MTRIPIDVTTAAYRTHLHCLRYTMHRLRYTAYNTLLTIRSLPYHTNCDTQLTIHCFRYTIHCLQYTADDTRYTAYNTHDTLLTIHDTLLTIHCLQYTAYDTTACNTQYTTSDPLHSSMLTQRDLGGMCPCTGHHPYYTGHHVIHRAHYLDFRVMGTRAG